MQGVWSNWSWQKGTTFLSSYVLIIALGQLAGPGALLIGHFMRFKGEEIKESEFSISPNPKYNIVSLFFD
jgi:hypothetical protein